MWFTERIRLTPWSGDARLCRALRMRIQGPMEAAGDTVVDHIRLFPVIEGVRWLPGARQILRASRGWRAIEWTDITVRHTGYANRALRSRKLDRDSRILLEELAERPNDPFTLFNLGSIAIERASGMTRSEPRRGLAGSAPTDSITRKLYALIARGHQMLGDLPAALKSCAEGLSIDPDDAELWFRKAVVHRHGGQPAEAEQCWRRIRNLSRPQKFASVDQGIYGQVAGRDLAAWRSNAATTKKLRGNGEPVLAECPADEAAANHVNGAAGNRNTHELVSDHESDESTRMMRIAKTMKIFSHSTQMNTDNAHAKARWTRRSGKIVSADDAD